jgi:hypothetical protein
LTFLPPVRVEGIAGPEVMTRTWTSIGQLAKSVFWLAVGDAEVKPRLFGWRNIEHNYLEQALVGMAQTLPKAVASDAAIGAARDAREEIVRALEELKTGAPKNEAGALSGHITARSVEKR